MKVGIFGASGLVGNDLLKLLVIDPQISKILVFNRKLLVFPVEYSEKVEQILCDYDKIQAGLIEIDCEVIFNCLGTTIKNAKTKENQEKIDAFYPIEIAKIAKSNGAIRMISVSSIGASQKGNFYLKTKAKMESGITAIFQNEAYFVRPSMLRGQRKEFRFSEKMGLLFMRFFDLFLRGNFKKYRSVSSNKVAEKMIFLIKGNKNNIHFF